MKSRNGSRLLVVTLLLAAVLALAVAGSLFSPGESITPTEGARAAERESSSTLREVAERSRAPREEPAQEVEEGAPPKTVVSGTPSHGTVSVEVRTSRGSTPRECTVQLVQHSGVLEARDVDETGVARFTGVALGEYWVRVDPDSLEEGLLPPGQQDVQVHGDAGGAYRRDLELTEANPTASLVIELGAASTVYGYVYGPAGEPLEHVGVQVGSTQHPGLAKFEFTDESGFYECTDVEPGSWWVQIQFDPRHSYPRASNGSRINKLSAPPPDPFVLVGDQAIQKDLWLGSGKCSVRGRVVDQDGKPFPRLNVLAHYKNTEGDGLPRMTWNNAAGRGRTNADGEYHIDELYSYRVGIIVGPNAYSASAPVGSGLLADWPESVEADLKIDCEAVVPTVVARRSRPFRIEGRLIVDPAFLERNSIDDPGHFQLAVVRSMRRRESDPPDQPRVRTDKVRLQEDWTFEWATDELPDHATLEVTAFGMSERAVREYQIDVIAGATVDFPAHFP